MSSTETATVQLVTYVTPSEANEIRQAAAADQRKVSAWLRLAVLAALETQERAA